MKVYIGLMVMMVMGFDGFLGFLMYKTLNISQYMSSVACICAAGNDGDAFN
jgi:hypothetical protein